MNNKQIPIGIDDFKEIIERDAYFVDKSMFIKKITENISKVILLTRPRRFGKTLNFSMLKYFLEKPECRKLKGDNQDLSYLFETLQIYKEDELVDNYLGKFPVIDLSFKKVKANNWEKAEYYFKEVISEEYKKHRYLLDENDMLNFEKKQYQEIMNKQAKIYEYTSAIKNLSDYLSTLYEKKVIVLIDEYDTPLHYAKLNGYYDEMLDIMRALMVDGMKGNNSLEKGVVTGIMKISQESIFSSFNNPEISTVIDGYCSDMFGFTEREVKTILDYYGLSKEMETVQEWYNGYLFGSDKIIYNPWSILQFIKTEDHKPRPYWVNTGDPELIKRSLQLDQIQGKKYIEDFYNGKSIQVEVEQNIVYEDVFNNVEKALSFLLHSGYLKAEEVEDKINTYALSIPNKEIIHIYKDILKNWFNREQKTGELVIKLIDSLFEKDLDSFEILLQDLLIINTSYYDSIKKRERSVKGEEKEKQENFYHGLILGLMLYLSDDYYIESNKEYGLGRPDIVILPKDLNENVFIIEFKNEYTTSKNTVKQAAQKALEQIKENKYEEGVKKTGVEQVIKIGLGFKGKEVAVDWEL